MRKSTATASAGHHRVTNEGTGTVIECRGSIRNGGSKVTLSPVGSPASVRNMLWRALQPFDDPNFEDTVVVFEGDKKTKLITIKVIKK